jgi:PilZ domain
VVSPAAKKGFPALRSRRRVTVHFGAGNTKHIGYSGNVSRTGMMIRTTRVFEPGTVLTLQVEHLTQSIHLEGRVIWARVGELRWLSTGKIGMGIRFINAPEDLMKILFPIAASG